MQNTWTRPLSDTRCRSVSETVHVVAIGGRTPVGLTADRSAAAVRAGVSRVSEHPFFTDREGEPVRAACDSRCAPQLEAIERSIEMLAAALGEISRTLPATRSVPLLLAVPEERPGWSAAHVEKLKREVTQRFNASFDPLEVLPHGHAGGLVALETAFERIRTRQIGLCLVAGVDSYLDSDTLSWLDDTKQLATSYHRNGFLPGEGAGAIALAGGWLVDRHRLESLAVIRGVGTSIEAKRIKTDTVCLGEGLSEAVGKALASLRLPEEIVDGVIGDINGERYRSEEWGLTLLRFPDALTDPTAYELPASCWGDVGAASGPLFVMLAAAAGRRGWAKGPRYLIWSGSESGRRAATVVEVAGSQRGVSV
jgi:3-oxoacyl-[acyl-carrier-protein] synthase I